MRVLIRLSDLENRPQKALAKGFTKISLCDIRDLENPGQSIDHWSEPKVSRFPVLGGSPLHRDVERDDLQARGLKLSLVCG